MLKRLLLSLISAALLTATAQAESVTKAVHPAVYPAVYKVDCTPWQYLDYNFYADFLRSSTDQADALVMSNATSAGKYDYLGNTYGENVPVIEPGKGMLTYGEYTQLVQYSENTGEWTGSGPWTQSINITATGVYTVSTDLSTATITITAGTATIDAGASATYGTPDQFEVTGTGTVTISSDVADPKAQITKTAYKMPYAVNATSGTVTVPKSSANADEGSKYAIGAGSKLKTALYGTDGSDAQGRIVVKWRPMFDAADVSTDVNIITANDDSDGLLYYDASAEMLITTNGTNLAAVACTPVSGTLYTIEIAYDDELQISVDSTSGYAVAFNGVWPNGDNLSFGWDATAPQFVEKLYFQKEPDPITDHDEEFLYTVVDTQVVAGVFSTTDEITVYWGDGNSDTYDGTDQAYSHDYGSAGFHVVSVVGKSLITKITMTTVGANIHCSLADLPVNLIIFDCQGSNSVAGSLSDLPINLTYFVCNGLNTISGSLTDLPANLTLFGCQGSNQILGSLSDLPINLIFFVCQGANRISGSLTDLPANLTSFACGGANTVSGLLSDLPTNLTYLSCFGSNQISGALSDLPVNVAYLNCQGLNTISDYTTKTWTTKPTTFICVPTGVGGLSETEINQLLIDLDDDFDWTTGTIKLTGTNAAPTGAGATAASNMDTEGATVTTN